MNDILIIGLLLLVVIAGTIILLLLKPKPHSWRSIILKKLEEIDVLVQTTHENDLRTALIKIDALLDSVLQQKRIPGESLGERLKNARQHFDHSTYNAVWEAHKLRNKIVHEVDFRPPIAFIKQHYIELRLGIKQLMKA